MGRFLLIAPTVLFAVGCTADPNILKKRYFEAGNKYFQKQKYKEASIMYRTALRKDPRYGEAYYGKALAEIRLGQLGDAASSLPRAVELLPEGPDRLTARVQLADLYLSYISQVPQELEIKREIGVLADEILLLDPNSFDGHRIRASISFANSLDLARKLPVEAATENREAISDFRIADRIRPLNPQVTAGLARALQADHQLEAAEAYLKSLAAAHPKFETAYSELCRFYELNNRLNDAEATLKTAADNNPERYEFLAQLAGFYQSTGKRQEMVKTLERLKANADGRRIAYKLSGTLYLKSGDPEAAMREFEEGARLFPAQKLTYRKLMMNALMVENKNAEAIKLNNEILKENPLDAETQEVQAELLLKTGEIQKAITQLEALLQRMPENVKAHYDLGRALIASGRREEAQIQFSVALQHQPNYAPAQVALARIEMETGEYGKAVALVEAVLGADPNNIEARLIRSAGLLSMRKLPEARSEIGVLLRVYPHNDRVLFQSGQLNAIEGKWKEAEIAFLASYAANPTNLAGLLAVGERYWSLNQIDRAIGLIRGEVVKHPDRVDLAMMYAAFLGSGGHRQEAIAQYELLLTKLKGNPTEASEVERRLGEQHFRSGDAQGALAYYQKAISVRRDDPMILTELGLAYHFLGRQQEAAQQYEACLRVGGRNPMVLNNLAYYIAENGGDLDRALTFAQRARQSTPGELGYSDTVAYIYLKKNLVDNALEMLEDLVHRKPDNPTFRLHLAQALFRKGESVKAKKELQTALDNRPSLEDTQSIKALLSKIGT